MAERPEVRQMEPEPLRAEDLEPAIRALLGGHPAQEVEAAIAAGLRSGGYFDPIGVAGTIVRVATGLACHWTAELRRGGHPGTVSVLGMVMLQLDHRLRAWAEDDSGGALAPIAATRARLIAGLIPDPPPGLNVIQSHEGMATWERLEAERPDPVRVVRILQVLGASRSWAYSFLRDSALAPDVTDRDVPDEAWQHALSKLRELRRRRLLYDRATAPGRQRRSAYRLRQRHPNLRPTEIAAPRRRRRA